VGVGGVRSGFQFLEGLRLQDRAGELRAATRVDSLDQCRDEEERADREKQDDERRQEP
jgi:hypothetical protein